MGKLTISVPIFKSEIASITVRESYYVGYELLYEPVSETIVGILTHRYLYVTIVVCHCSLVGI